MLGSKNRKNALYIECVNSKGNELFIFLLDMVYSDEILITFYT